MFTPNGIFYFDFFERLDDLFSEMNKLLEVERDDVTKLKEKGSRLISINLTHAGIPASKFFRQSETTVA